MSPQDLPAAIDIDKEHELVRGGDHHAYNKKDIGLSKLMQDNYEQIACYKVHLSTISYSSHKIARQSMYQKNAVTKEMVTAYREGIHTRRGVVWFFPLPSYVKECYFFAYFNGAIFNCFLSKST